MKIKDKTILFFATGGFVGYIPFAPGTFGTLHGIWLYFFLYKMPFIFSVLFISAFIIFSVLISDKAEKINGVKDPSIVVIDEIAGMLITMIGIKFNFINILTGFILFRFFDILKPFPVYVAEKKLPGGVGIVADDVIAGIMANLLIRFLFYLK
ncbi:MAG: phosphatidylglycerophosphatase A [Deltaproteobacteria bacterium]|nr:phosphatidylglycerophosphatase A [Deltaproteobacteria bacterium]